MNVSTSVPPNCQIPVLLTIKNKAMLQLFTSEYYCKICCFMKFYGILDKADEIFLNIQTCIYTIGAGVLPFAFNFAKA